MKFPESVILWETKKVRFSKRMIRSRESNILSLQSHFFLFGLLFYSILAYVLFLIFGTEISLRIFFGKIKYAVYDIK